MQKMRTENGILWCIRAVFVIHSFQMSSSSLGNSAAFQIENPAILDYENRASDWHEARHLPFRPNEWFKIFTRNKTMGNRTDTKVSDMVYCQLCACYNASDGMHVDCSFRGISRAFNGISKDAVEVSYRGNSLVDVKDTDFTGLQHLHQLDLSQNVIFNIEEGAFDDLKNLVVLLLNNNGFVTFTDPLVPVNSFASLQNLRLLTLHGNIVYHLLNVSRIDSKLFRSLYRLEYLTIDGLTNIEFDENYRHTNMSTLVMSSMIGHCGIVSLSNKTFRGLPKLRQLTMTGCEISQITENIFSSVPLLAYLDISNNFKLGLYNAIGPLAKSLNLFNIKTLKMNFLSTPADVGTKLTKENLKYVNAMSLVHLEVDSNNIEIFENSALNMSRGTLSTLSMQNNKLLFSLSVASIIWDNPSLVEVDLRGQFKFKIPATNTLYTKLTPSRDQFNNKFLTLDVTNTLYNRPLLSRDQEYVVSLKKFLFTGSRYLFEPLDFYNTSNSLWYMDISENRIARLKKYHFENLNHLTILNLSNNYIEKVDSNSFEDLVALKNLSLQNNLLGFEMGFGNLDKIFKPLLRLEHLILARNRIYAIKKDMFSSCKQLQFLDLSDNYLNNLDIDVSQLQNLYLLNLRTNRIQSFPLAVQKGLETITNHSSLTVNLMDNKLVCSCGNLNFLKWILSSNITFIKRASYKCTFMNSTSVFIRSENISTLEMECHRYLTVIMTCTALASLFLATITAAIGYRYRWHILYWYYMAKLKDRTQGEQQNIYERLFEWDAYISYDDEDLHFVAAKMQPELEERLHYKLHIRERDFVLGETNSLNILNAVQQSKRTLLIISRHFLKNKWCNFEINMATIEGIKSERGVVILVFLEKIPAVFMPKDLAALLTQCPVVDWPQCEDVAEAFWTKLVNNIDDYNDISEN